MRRIGYMGLLTVALYVAQTSAQSSSVVLVAQPNAAAWSANAQVVTQQELHPLKARFERQRVRDLRQAGGSIEPMPTLAGDTMTLPPIEITHSETEATTLSDDARLKKNVAEAFGPERVRVALSNGQQVINGTPLPGVAWQAWTNPGNIQFWLR